MILIGIVTSAKVMYMKINELFTLFLHEKSVYCSKSTITYYKNMLHKFNTFLEQSNIDDSKYINDTVLKSYILSLRASDVKNTSIHTYFRAVKNLCSWAILGGKMQPFNYKVALQRPDPDKILPLSASEVDQIDDYIIKNCSDYDHKMLFFHLLLDCGLRSSEAINIRYCDFDEDSHILSIKNSKYNKSRLIPCPDRVFTLIDFPDNRDNLIFNFGDSGKSSFFARIKSHSGVKRVYPHLCRHTFATSYMMKRGNLEYLRRYMGHSSYDVTKIYIDSAFDCNILHYDIYKIDDIFS